MSKPIRACFDSQTSRLIAQTSSKGLIMFIWITHLLVSNNELKIRKRTCKRKKAGLQLWPLAWGAKWPRMSEPTQRKDWKHNQHLILIWNSLVCTENLTWTHPSLWNVLNSKTGKVQVRSLDGYTNWDGSNKSFHGVWWIGYPPPPKRIKPVIFQ